MPRTINVGSERIGRKTCEHRADLQQLADYANEKMKFAIVLLPLASWHHGLPYPRQYQAMVEEFCMKNKEVRLYNLSGIASDDDFIDHIHMNQRGLPKSDAALMEIAREFLKKTGAWPMD